MIAEAARLTDLYLSLAALAGLVILHRVVRARGADAPINRRFLFGLRVAMLIFAGRALVLLTGWVGFRFFVFLGAGLVPLAVILLVEGLNRRHAPAWVKSYVAIGSVLAVITAFWAAPSIDPPRLIALLVFQVSGLVLGGWLVLSRDRASLSAAENRTVERLALALIPLVPLAAADFLMVYWGLPVQVSPLGVLFLCWLAIGLGRSAVGHATSLWSFAALVLGAGFAGGVIAMLAAMDRDATIMTLAIVLAGFLVAILYVEANALRREEDSASLLRHMARARPGDAVGFLRGLAAHPLVAGAVLIEAEQLEDLDRPTLLRALQAAPVLRRAAPPFADGPLADHVTHLFDSFEASHILLANDAPLTLVALSMPQIAASPRAELELDAVQRMAWLMSRGERT
ncbi:MAG: Protein of unknown function (DUF1686) [Rhodobacteraceae bacterium HLUCCA08]|nr:MAG: Protein of unknown function (DUF1686) [Rhodobacteraceae bacterium HLUCCA08]